VINRGNCRFPAFGEDRDRELILEELVDLAERLGVHVRACCVQINHLHWSDGTRRTLGPITVSGLGSSRQMVARRLRESRTFRDRVAETEARTADPESRSDD
jgi:hypothetical protein